MSRNLDDLLPQVKVAWGAACAEIKATLGLDMFVVYTMRTPEEQHELFLEGRTKPGQPCRHTGDSAPRPIGSCPVHPMGATVTKADYWASWHVVRRAIDGVPIRKSDGKLWWTAPAATWHSIAAITAKYGFTWGGAWGDMDHFEMKEGLNLAQAKAEILKLQGTTGTTTTTGV